MIDVINNFAFCSKAMTDIGNFLLCFMQLCDGVQLFDKETLLFPMGLNYRQEGSEKHLLLLMALLGQMQDKSHTSCSSFQ